MLGSALADVCAGHKPRYFVDFTIETMRAKFNESFEALSAEKGAEKARRRAAKSTLLSAAMTAQALGAPKAG